MSSCDLNDSSTVTIQQALIEAAKNPITPVWFIPSINNYNQFKQVTKSQITLMIQYLVTNRANNSTICLNPPQILPISPKVPNITMFKLMMVLENSSEGMSHIIEEILQQTQMSGKDFFSTLQIFKGNLGSCNYSKVSTRYVDLVLIPI